MRLIQSCCVFLVPLAITLAACQKTAENAPSIDAGVAQAQPDAGQAQPGPADGGSAEASEPDAGTVAQLGDPGAAANVYRARGRAPRGPDISLARQAVANRARANLAKLLKDKGLSAESPVNLKDATIERFYARGRYVYAVAAMTLPEQDGSVNVPASDPSNTHGKDSTGDKFTPPDGGHP